MDSLRYLKFKAILQKNSWIQPGYLGVDRNGVIQYLSSDPPDDRISEEVTNGIAIPGWTNAHSHAFQYAMAGIAERHPSDTEDDFWTWREAMYQCALSIDPGQAEAIATMLYAEMLRYGYTNVVEFHYLHHDKNGKPYSNLAEMGERMVSAAATAGISITLVPVFYQKGGFGIDPQTRQRRFISRTPEDYFNLLSASRQIVGMYPGANLGFSFHSLRAVDLKDIVSTFNHGPANLPFHFHIAEQKREVNDCLAWCGKRPVQWLMENLPVNDRFHLVHATHLDEKELFDLADTGATVVLCPSTEGNLGDGIFRMKEFCKQGGHWTIGTDSHIGLDPVEELRMIDYRQRLITHQRNTFPEDASHYMIQEAIVRGQLSSGTRSNENFEKGKILNAVIYDASSPLLENSSRDNWLSTLVFAPGASRVYGTICRGQWQVKDGHHKNYEPIKKRFSKALEEISTR